MILQLHDGFTVLPNYMYEESYVTVSGEFAHSKNDCLLLESSDVEQFVKVLSYVCRNLC